MVRLGGSPTRAGVPLLKRPPRIPDPGQCVDLRMEDDSWRKGFRALSEPSTDRRGVVVIWVATEDECREAQREGRSAVGMPWPTERMRLSPARLPWQLSYPASSRARETPAQEPAGTGPGARAAPGGEGAQEGAQRPWWWRMFGG